MSALERTGSCRAVFAIVCMADGRRAGRLIGGERRWYDDWLMWQYIGLREQDRESRTRVCGRFRRRLSEDLLGHVSSAGSVPLASNLWMYSQCRCIKQTCSLISIEINVICSSTVQLTWLSEFMSSNWANIRFFCWE